MPYRLLFVLTALSASAGAWEFQGEFAVEGRLFPQDGLRPGADYRANVSAFFEPEFYHSWDEGRQSFTFTPFGRIDQHDGDRTHFDVREFTWQYAGRSWELRTGIRKVFWGVAESAHLVDVINQTDLVENLDGEEKLGQPMVNFALIQPWGDLDLFILPGFRERTFFSPEGRPGFPISLDDKNPSFEAGNGTGHVDYAVRWFKSLGLLDLGVSHFRGTSRDPRFLEERRADGGTFFRPRYDVINQTGIDLQLTTGAWLIKYEMINRFGQPFGDQDRFIGFVGGFEYTFSNIRASGIDVGVLAEYNFDERDELALTPLEDDLFFAARIALNDVPDTEILAGAAIDRETGATFLNVEADRRIGSRMSLELQGRFFLDVPPSDLFLFGVRNDDYVQAGWSFFF